MEAGERATFFPVRARGSVENPRNRFEAQWIQLDGPLLDDDGEPIEPRTMFLRDDTQSILAYNDSPDVSFDVGCSPYRGSRSCRSSVP